MSKKFLIPIAALVAICLATGMFYMLGLPPFAKRGEIKASDICESLGSPTKAVSALEATLPSEPEYSFEDTVTGKNVAQEGSSFTAACFAYGDKETLLSARTEMLLTEPAESWADYALDEKSGSDRESFKAGSAGFITANNKVVLQVPCAKAGSIPGGEYSLSVVVDLKTDTTSDDAKVRQGLKDLTVGAARYSHERAKCNLPSELPE
ncbi:MULTISPECIES: hypothetical protein [unclassified Streptomyces]|uniref:hypothetical protein n=1 Tax=unclassified Streptomyces TaxID=2593676 RepID=UPI003443A57F